MMFASKTPRDLNHDRFPYLWPEEKRTQRLSDGPLRSMFPKGDGIDLIHDPRPEFDHVQHNTFSPILADVRRYRQGRALMNNPKGWDHILRTFLRAKEHGLYTTNDWEKITHPGMLEHAEKVLRRAAEVFG